MLKPEQRRKLLEIARTSIAETLSGRQPSVDAGAVDAELRRPSGSFVTLRTRDGELRGCIGSLHPVAPLYQAVATSAIHAAFHDPRFDPVTADELSRLEIEISVMGPIEPVANTDEILVGRDGLIVSQAHKAGLLLPQVATEYGWDRDMFLRQTCVKAGLRPDTWRSADCRIEKFSAEVFGETDPE
jgi:AmmeMemoRadiSam system protein A